MRKLIKELISEKSFYDRLAEEAGKSLAKGHFTVSKSDDDERLRVANRKKSSQYFCVTRTGDTKGTYIPLKERDHARRLAQRDYDREVYEYAENCSKSISRMINVFSKKDVSKMHVGNPGRTRLINPYVLADEEYINEWLSIKYETLPFGEDDPEYYTDKGERVRSKSEKIIADKLFSMGIPYHYEKPLFLKGAGTVYPDFTILNVARRKTILLEHFGMMGDPDYSSGVARKIQLYEKNGIFQGRDIICTYESAAAPLNTKNLDALIRIFLLE